MLNIEEEIEWMCNTYPYYHLEKPQHMLANAFNKRGDMVGMGVNSYIKTHPVQAKYAHKVAQPSRIFLHAEISALVRAKYMVHELIVIRFNPSTKELRPSKPCPICMEAMQVAGVKQVHFINNKGVIESHGV